MAAVIVFFACMAWGSLAGGSRRQGDPYGKMRLPKRSMLLGSGFLSLIAVLYIFLDPGGGREALLIAVAAVVGLALGFRVGARYYRFD